MSKSLQDEFIKKELLHGAQNYSPLSVVLEKGKGVYLWDVDGNKYLDMVSAYSAVSHGHSHPELVKTIKEQSEKLAITSRAFYNNELGSSLEYITDTFGYEKMLPMNSGAEAVETAIKICRKWGYEIKKVDHNRAKILVCDGNFHGRTTTVVSFSSHNGSKENFGPLTDGFEIISYNNTLELEKKLKEDSNIVGFLVEPIQGEGGVVVPDNGYLKKCKILCEQYNVLLLVDEIQTGVCRTGKLLASYHENIKPDIVILGKALSGGFYPVSGVLTSKEIMSVMKVGEHGSTFGGNPLACVVAKEAIKYSIDNNLSEKADKLGNIFRNYLNEVKDEIRIMKTVRGKGLLNAIVLNCKGDSEIPWNICLDMRDNGLIAKPTQGNKIRFAPPLVIKEKEMLEALKIIEKSLRKF